MMCFFTKSWLKLDLQKQNREVDHRSIPSPPANLGKMSDEFRSLN